MPRARRILVIENNRVAAELVSRIFEVDDYEVVVARDEASALALAHEARPDAVVVDLEDPRLSGRGLLADLRGDAALRDVPVIAITKEETESLPTADVVIAGPLDHDGLLALLRCVHGYAGLPDPTPSSLVPSTLGAR